jgi:sugar phosphate isomerase/epimerase
MNAFSRRDLLKNFAAGAAGAAALSMLPRSLSALQEGDPAYGGFKMGIQTYSLRNFDLDKALDLTKDLGLRYAQAYPGKHLPITQDKAQIEAYKEKFRSRGITLVSWGVVGLGKDHEKNKAYFEFAKAMGMPVLVADPAPDAFESLSSLVKDYGVKIAIHNHGPRHRYDKHTDVLKAVEKYPVEIGACVDTGHYIRSGEDAGKVIRALGPRVHDVHLKDAVDAKTFAVLGKGKIDVLDTLKALKEVKFDGILALEYEEKPQDPIADIRECLAATREAAKKL